MPRCRMPLYLLGIPKRSRFESISLGILGGCYLTIAILTGGMIYNKIKAPKPRPPICRDVYSEGIENMIQRSVPESSRLENKVLYSIAAFTLGGMGGLLYGRIKDGKVKAPNTKTPNL